ncbi:lamin tail domain-containing protein [Candidatus Woesearchaeota archaeon]|jgi:hypothetical protein|nr:lamin tail domain-containing protein [Candidatus Woesearchaeota archaeon]MBT3304804.1 lamin tail domain-containing protein [Candidatus Woesearchaeota archaeon]MBT4367860.1 lamin tail domain-containing protein [Candidatus Woesearchaeota archaeon]MBT4712348.1 lamin tail domain-containing protein [Candidatus Woesearchaeota archaeon]MBT6639260.1 lamin tail domain-containing protein [Candidatus Woesearchaeota archaeon]
MKKLFCLAIAMLVLPLVLAVRIEEVYYDPVETESGGEAVVLYNPLDLAVDISGWTIKTETSDADVILPLEAVIGAQGYYLITDIGWDESKDDEMWNGADYEEAMTLGNSDAGVALVDSLSQIVSSVGWGDSSEIESGLYEGSPAVDVEPGSSLLRVQSLGNNFVDFVSSSPQLNSGSSDGNETHQGIVINLNVLDYSVSVDWVNISPDAFGDEGVQVLLNPGREKEIIITSMITHEFNYSFIENVTVNNQSMVLMDVVNKTSAIFELKLDLNYSILPGSYDVLVFVGEEQKSNNYEILSLMAIDVDVEELNLEVKEKNLRYALLGDQNWNVGDKPSIKNIGNVGLDLGVKATELVGEDANFLLENVRYSFNNDFYSSKAGQLSTELEIVNLNLEPADINEFGLEFFVTEEVEKGSYEGKIMLSAVSSE